MLIWTIDANDRHAYGMPPVCNPEREDGSVRLELVEADITTQRVDAIVNAANSSLLGGAGVDGAIHRVGGPEILAECRELRKTLPDGLPVGDAVATTAGQLPARWVIHTVGPVFVPERAQPELLAAAYRNSLVCADQLGAIAVAFPLISAGTFRWPVAQAAQIAVQAVQSAAAAGCEVELVRFVAFNAPAADALAEALTSTSD